MDEKYYSVKEVGEILRRSNRTIYAYIRSGQLKAHQMTQSKNAKFIIAESDLKEFMKVGARPGYYQALYPRPHKGDNL